MSNHQHNHQEERDPLFPPATGDVSQSADWIVGVIDNLSVAQQAERALLDAGFADTDVVLLSGPEAIHRLQVKEEQRGPLGWVRKAFASVTTDADYFESAYEEHANAGHAIINIHSDDPNWISRATAILKRYDAHNVKHYGPWVITDLP
ncbi:MAG TPA: hypothetical protein VF792_09430 [Ktedonobacterales bacterium]